MRARNHISGYILFSFESSTFRLKMRLFPVLESPSNWYCEYDISLRQAQTGYLLELLKRTLDKGGDWGTSKASKRCVTGCGGLKSAG